MLIVGLLVSTLFHSCCWCGPVIDFGYVKYEGFQNTTIGINYFRGIRYGQAPIGPLRWRPPVLADSEADGHYGAIVDATQFGPACYQSIPPWSMTPRNLFATYGESEDCLLLDVLVPVSPTSHALPVIVQIPAGGYVVGSSSTVPGDRIVNWSNGSLIYVEIQYRLGMFGFLGGEDIKKDGSRNAGLLDQQLALAWVQKHISKFGGDPNKVTLVGMSRLSSIVSFF